MRAELAKHRTDGLDHEVVGCARGDRDGRAPGAGGAAQNALVACRRAAHGARWRGRRVRLGRPQRRDDGRRDADAGAHSRDRAAGAGDPVSLARAHVSAAGYRRDNRLQARISGCSSRRWAACTPSAGWASISPRVALLANGEEASKGDRLVQEAHKLLRASALNFIGNAEPKDALSRQRVRCAGLRWLRRQYVHQAGPGGRAAVAGAGARRGRARSAAAPAAGLLAAAACSVWDEARAARAFALLGMLGAAPALLGNLLDPSAAARAQQGRLPLLWWRAAAGPQGRGDRRAWQIRRGGDESAIRQAKEAVERGAVTGIADAIGPLNGVPRAAP